MSIGNGILGDKKFVVKSLMALVGDEGQRIMSLGLASHEELNDLLKPTIQRVIKKAGTNPESMNVLLGILSDLHTKLVSVKLPGDFAVVAADEKFYEALDIPYTGEKFHELSGLKEEGEVNCPKCKGKEGEGCPVCGGLGSLEPTHPALEPEEKELEEALEEYIEKEDSEEDHAEDCGCMYCFTSVINTYLTKLAYSLGSSGDHEAAYLVERAIYSIQNFSKRGK